MSHFRLSKFNFHLDLTKSSLVLCKFLSAEQRILTFAVFQTRIINWYFTYLQALIQRWKNSMTCFRPAILPVTFRLIQHRIPHSILIHLLTKLRVIVNQIRFVRFIFQTYLALSTFISAARLYATFWFFIFVILHLV